MADKFKLTVVTPERTVWQSDVVSVVAPAEDGYFGVLAHHAPMLAGVGVGRMTATSEADEVMSMAVSGGFAEVRDNAMTVLADAAELQNEIDVTRAEEAAKRARERLAEGTIEIDVPRAQAALARALNRVDIAAHRR